MLYIGNTSKRRGLDTVLDSMNRIKKSAKRPLAFNSTDFDLMNLIKKRSNIYSKALFEIKCDNLSKNQIVKKILDIYETCKIKN